MKNTKEQLLEALEAIKGISFDKLQIEIGGSVEVISGDNIEETVREALNHQIQCLEADDGWLPVETAPKDGTEIMAVWKYPHKPAKVDFIRFNRKQAQVYECDIWDTRCEHTQACEVLLWRPLPQPPIEQDTQGGE